MILYISGRTDIVAFYTPWLMNRFKQGFVHVRNPFYPSQVSKLSFDNVDAIIFCTKNPIPIIEHIPSINKPMVFQITCTPYHKDIEPFVYDKSKVIEAIKKISKMIGKDKIYIRYDPILFNDKYDLKYHLKAFKRLCSLLDGYTNKIIISFIDDYKNVKRHQSELNLIKPDEKLIETICHSFVNIAQKHKMSVQACHEDKKLLQYGLIDDVCVSLKMAFELTSKTNYNQWAARDCGCIEMVDIGVYNTCKHYCKYCYANYDETKIISNTKKHDPNSSFLIGNHEVNDFIKERFK